MLETNVQATDGQVTVIDCMPVSDGPLRVVRLVIGRAGNVRMRFELTTRFYYGSIVPWAQLLNDTWTLVAGLILFE